ncbi:hypothetical protein CC78DRAFT_533995 [Lojkania enalia]|uniref:Uncharacterized protein n=1 Tax=Lojkania enalia TaxID=147567 RepID=A0A9P4N398_9PLEO|nr:hypothetical protein CC78DRAFT_533995 [Didymosphaeria enalia]
MIDVAEKPEFALGDSSSIAPSNLYTILLVDTTCDDARTLHFARANYKYLFDITKIGSESDALLEYQAPGAFGETGDERKYSFLMYKQPGNDEITELSLPGEGEAFDVKQFQDDNGLEDAIAGVGMVVKLGGETSCDGQPASPLPSSPASSSESAPESTDAPEPSSSGSEPSSTPAITSAAVTRASSSAAASETTETSEEPESTQADDSQTETETDLVVATSAVQSGPQTNTVFQTIATADVSTSGSPTNSSAPAQQTDNGASGLSVVSVHCGIAASLVAFIGLFVL